MDLGWLAGLTGFAVAMTATPGPNNTMVAASGATFGLTRSIPVSAGIAVGVATIMLVVAGFGAAVMENPLVGQTLKWVGVLFLLWLAWKIASAEPVIRSEPAEPLRGRPLSFAEGALFQLVNPKLWVAVSGAVAAYGRSGDTGRIAVALLFAAIFGVMTFASVIAWTMLGASVGRVLASRRAIRIFNLVMAGLLVLSLAPVLLA